MWLLGSTTVVESRVHASLRGQCPVSIQHAWGPVCYHDLSSFLCVQLTSESLISVTPHHLNVN